MKLSLRLIVNSGILLSLLTQPTVFAQSGREFKTSHALSPKIDGEQSVYKLAFLKSTQDGIHGKKSIYTVTRKSLTPGKIADDKCGKNKLAYQILSWSPSNDSMIEKCNIGAYSIDVATGKARNLPYQGIQGDIQWISEDAFWFVTSSSYIYEGKIDGSPAKKILLINEKNFDISRFQISPDKKNILLVNDWQSPNTIATPKIIYQYNQASGKLTKITKGDYPIWLSNTTFLFFKNKSFYRMDISSGKTEKIVDSGVTNTINDSSLTNNKFIYTSDIANKNQRKTFYVLDLDFLNVKKTTLNIQLPSQYTMLFIYDSSPDGREIALRTTQSNYLYVANLDTGSVQQITKDGFVLSAHWNNQFGGISYDGKYKHGMFSASYPHDWKYTQYSKSQFYFHEGSKLSSKESKNRFLVWLSPDGHGGPAACFKKTTTKTDVKHLGFKGVREECDGAVTYTFTEKLDQTKTITKGETGFFEVWFEFKDGKNNNAFIKNVLDKMTIK